MVLANKLKKDKLVAKQQTSFDDSGIASEASFNLTEELPGDSKESPILTKALKINAQYKAEPKVSKELKNLTIDMSMASPSGTGSNNESRKHIMRNLPRTKGSIKKRLRPQNVPRSNVERRRRVRCHVSVMCDPPSICFLVNSWVCQLERAKLKANEYCKYRIKRRNYLVLF